MSTALRWLLAAAVALLCVSTVWIGPGDLSDPERGPVYLMLRLYRAAAAFITGACLSVAGVLAQGLFRNPLASPSILGTTAGASFGGQLALLTWRWAPAALPLSAEAILPAGCFAGAALSLAIVLLFASRTRDLVTLLLVGFALSSVFLSAGSLVVSLAQEQWELGRAVVAFALGGVGGVGREQIGLALPLAVGGIAIAWAWSGPLDLLLSGEDEAQSLGLDVGAATRWISAWMAVLVAAAVTLAGNLAFVGLVVPHAVRRTLGAQHRILVPGAAVAGGAFVTLCDGVVRAVPSQTEVPLGVVTSLLGVPLFLQLLLQMRKRGAID